MTIQKTPRTLADLIKDEGIPYNHEVDDAWLKGVPVNSTVGIACEKLIRDTQKFLEKMPDIDEDLIKDVWNAALEQMVVWYFG